MMDWCFGHDAGDLVVPKDQAYFDRLPSPDSWSHWGSTCNPGWLNNYDNDSKVLNFSDTEHSERLSFGRDNNRINLPEAELSYGSSNLAGSSDDFRPWNSAPSGGPDLQFSNLTGSDQMDDMFLSSLLHDDMPAATYNHSSAAIAHQSRSITIPTDSESTDRVFGFCDTEGGGSSKYFKTHVFSPSVESDNGHSTVPNLSYGISSSNQSDDPSVKASETMDMLLSDQEMGDEDSSIEESVLQGLETVLTQLNDKTRLCFRDSLYRLAHRSQPQMSTEVRTEVLPFETCDAQTRSARAESGTNTIDRAVANLMFHMDANILDLLPGMMAKYEGRRRPSSAMQPSNYGSNPGETDLSSKFALSSADSEVPVFRNYLEY